MNLTRKLLNTLLPEGSSQREIAKGYYIRLKAWWSNSTVNSVYIGLHYEKRTVPVSIIIPVYNSEKYLNRCLKSIVRQSWRPQEIIVVDNGSTDRSCHILEAYKKRYPELIHIIRIEHRNYAGAGRNIGMHAAKGKYIIFSDSDDTMPLHAVKNLYQTAVERNAEIVFAPFYYINGKKSEIRRKNEFLLNKRIELYDVLMNEEPSPWGKIFQASFLETVGDMPETFSFEDLAWFFTYGSRVQNAVSCDSPCYTYYVHSNSQVNDDKNIRILDSIKAEQYGLEHCSDSGREIVEYHIGKRLMYNNISRPFFQSSWIEHAVQLWPLLKKNTYLQNDRQLYYYISSLVKRAELKYSSHEIDAIDPSDRILRAEERTKKAQLSIKIFVSQRIDLKSYLIQNPLFINVRCGAVFDKSPSKLPGDDTGENISEKREYLNEFTVQYWAWKNQSADYYGLCHYRRFLSFNDAIYPTEHHGYVQVPALTKKSATEYCLLDEEKMRSVIGSYDLIVAEPFEVERDASEESTSVWKLWETRPFIDTSILYVTLDLIKKHSPEYYTSALEYLNGKWHRGYNCYIMNRELFNRMCQFQFPIIFELEEKISKENYSGNKKRGAAYMGELLFGVFVYHIIAEGYWKVKEQQLLFFKNVNAKEKTRQPKFIRAYAKAKKAMACCLPAYRVALRNEAALSQVQSVTRQNNVNLGINSYKYNLTTGLAFDAACFANEIHDTHVASFREFKNCNYGKGVVIVACGNTAKYYRQLENMQHIGMNAGFLNKNVKLDYYFTTDYEHRNDWFKELKNYDFIKFFGQYTTGHFREKYQIPEYIIEENHARRFYQGAPSWEIHQNIEYHPLMGFYSIVFQAIHFALYTRPQKIYLVGCDCAANGYFDGSMQEKGVKELAVPSWLKGYTALKQFMNVVYPDVEIISVNPVGLKGFFHDVYTEEYLNDHPEIDRRTCELLTLPNSQN